METVGYVFLSKEADCSKAMGDPSDWCGKILRAMEINEDTKSILLLNNAANGMGMFDLSDAELKFKCQEINGVIIPSELGMVEKMVYQTTRLTREGGYNETVKNMVIANSLRLGKVDDNFLFQV